MRKTTNKYEEKTFLICKSVVREKINQLQCLGLQAFQFCNPLTLSKALNGL